MVTLAQLYDKVGKYLQMHGDKELLSVGTCCPSSPVEFKLNVADIYNGPLGTNPYTGRDIISLYDEQDDTIKPCPFCKCRLKLKLGGDEPLWRHPDNNCIMAGMAVSKRRLNAWNSRKGE